MILDWNEIDTVMLDMDGTLLDLHFDNFFWITYLPDHYVKNFPGKEKRARQLLLQKLAHHRGTLEWYCTDFWTRELNVEIISLKEKISHLISERPYALEFLEALEAAGKSRMLVTNAHPKSLELKFSKTQISSLLNFVTTSHEYGHPKESQEFWCSLSHRTKFDPKRTLFIDDSLPVLRSAKEFGIRYILHINSPDSKLQPTPSNEFQSISHFSEILSANRGLLGA